MSKSKCEKDCKYVGDKKAPNGCGGLYYPCAWCKHDEWNKNHISANMVHDHYAKNA